MRQSREIRIVKFLEIVKKLEKIDESDLSGEQETNVISPRICGEKKNLCHSIFMVLYYQPISPILQYFNNESIWSFS